MWIIPSYEYALVRKKFLGNNSKLIKTGTQDMIRYFESGQNFPGNDKIKRQDFDSFILSELKNEDGDVRKWLYHLLCLYISRENDKQLIDSCLNNISIELDGNKENISWIAAVCAVHSDKQSDFESYLKMGKFQEYLTLQQIQLAGSAFRKDPFYSIDYAMLLKAVQADDNISAIWLTKTYANQFLPCVSKSLYIRNHGNIQIDLFADLLKYPDDVVRKYTMWAFAQERGGNITSILPYVPLSNVLSLESGVLKWFFVKMFQDPVFLNNNIDFLQEIQLKLKHLRPNDREGILIGCTQLGYLDSIAKFLIQWEVDSGEENESVLLRLYEYFLKNIDKNEDFREIIKSAILNIDTIPSRVIRDYLIEFIKGEKGEQIMSNGSIIVLGGNNQIISGGNNTQINNNALAQNQEQLQQQLSEIKKQLEQQDYITDEKYNNLISHLDYERNQIESVLKNNLQSDEIAEIRRRLAELEKLKNAPPKERGHRILRAISTISDLITIASSAQFYPEIISFAQNATANLKGLL